jgi:undecaprenyl-diphosphatase
MAPPDGPTIDSRDVSQGDAPAASPPRRTALAWAGVLVLAALAVAWGLTAHQVPAMVLALTLIAAAGIAVAAWGHRSHVVWLMLALAALSLFRVYYLVSGPFDLSGDECQYWDWSRHMDWSYCTKGPGVAAVIWLFRQAFGETVLAVRGPAVVLAFLSSLLLFRMGTRLADEKTGAIAAGLFQIVPVFAVFAVGMNTDPLLIFFWLLGLLALHRALTTGARWPWLVVGLAVGLGFLGKYTMAAFWICTLLLLLSSPGRRRHLRTPWPYLAVALSLAVMSPVFFWNMQHGWVNFRHNLTHVTGAAPINPESLPGRSSSQGPLANLLEFVGTQLGIVTPLLLVMMVLAAIWRRKQDDIGFWFCVPLLVLFLAKSLLGEVLANWALAAYLTGLVAFAAWFMRDFARRNMHARRLTVAAVVLGAVATAVVTWPLGAMDLWRQAAVPLGKLTGLSGRKLGAEADPLRKVRGWNHLAGEVDRLRPQMTQPYFILSDKYVISSTLAFYLRGNPRTYCANLGRRMNQFDLWPGFGGFAGQDAIYVRSGDEDFPPQLRKVFQSWDKTLVRPDYPFGEDYSIFVCHGFAGMKTVVPERY